MCSAVSYRSLAPPPLAHPPFLESLLCWGFFKQPYPVGVCAEQDPYFINISLTNFVVKIYLLEGSYTLVKACITSEKYIIFFTGKPRASYFCHINAHLVISAYKTYLNCKTYSDTTDIFLFFIKINYMLVQELLAIYSYAHRIIILTIYSRVRWRQVDSLRQKIETIRDVALLQSIHYSEVVVLVHRNQLRVYYGLDFFPLAS